MTTTYCANCEERLPDTGEKWLYCKHCLGRVTANQNYKKGVYVKGSEDEQLNNEEVKMTEKKSVRKKSDTPFRGYFLKCSVCGEEKKTNYQIYKKKKEDGTFNKHVCRDCQKKAHAEEKAKKKTKKVVKAKSEKKAD